MKSYVGIDIGHAQLKLVHVKDEKIVKIAIEPMPDNLVKDGYILSPEECGKQIRETMRKNKIKCDNAALMVPENCMYVKNVSMPQMPGDQLLCNLPYEFRDYISEKDSTFLFDYAVLETHEGKPVLDDNGNPTEETASPTMDVMAIAIRSDIRDNVLQTIKIAGMKLVKAAPEIVVYREFIQRQSDYTQDKEQCILDLGYNATRMYMFQGANLKAVRVIDHSIRNIEYVVAEQLGVDIHLAGSYLQSNYEGCQYADACIESYELLALEIARALKFYKFSNRESELENMLIWGGGSGIAPLVEAIRNTATDMKIGFVSEQLSEKSAQAKDLGFMALGMTFIPDGKEKNRPFQHAKARKTAINLAMIGYKPFNFKVAVPASVLIIILAMLFSKYAVVDRLQKVNSLKRQLADINAETELYQKQIEGYGDLVKTYAHYTYQNFEEEELKRADRADIIALINEKIVPKCEVGDWNIVENTLTISVVCNKLSGINEVASSVKKDKRVDYCTVSTASSGSSNGTRDDHVTGTLVIAFKDGALYNNVEFRMQDDGAENDAAHN